MNTEEVAKPLVDNSDDRRPRRSSSSRQRPGVCHEQQHMAATQLQQQPEAGPEAQLSSVPVMLVRWLCCSSCDRRTEAVVDMVQHVGRDHKEEDSAQLGYTIRYKVTVKGTVA